jgi:hypothetical protein
MKRVRIFFGVACLFLAIGAAVATNAMTNATTTYYYYTNPAAPNVDECEFADIPTTCNDATTTPCIEPVGALSARQLYKDAVCETILYKAAF